MLPGTRKALYLACFLLFAAVLTLPSVAHAQPAVWKVLLAEADNQGYEGMYAVACVIRNRSGDLSGFCGAKRWDLDAFCRRQGNKLIATAKDIEHRVLKANGPDTTNGATHFENVRAYGMPEWARNMRVVKRIKDHTFFKQ